MKKITADRVHTVSGDVLRDVVVVVDDFGKIEAILPMGDMDNTDVMVLDGDLVPGFVNAHCHLELSHMKGLAKTGTGLLAFLKKVVNFRDFPQEVILDAIEKADREMYDNGIMAVGDISNKTDSFAVKAFSKMRYFTFVEFFNLMQDECNQSTWSQYIDVYKKAPNKQGHKRSCVPHAPYSVSRQLFEKLRDADLHDGSVSIHNQETPAENELFVKGTGDFHDFFRSFGLSIDDFEPTGQRAIHYAMTYMNPDVRTLMVHNTTSTEEDILAAMTWSPHTYWVTCPNANLYIENQLPRYEQFIKTGATVCIGTDSLTSNWQLSIFEEMKTILRYQSFLTFEQVLQWATLNGAKALGYNDTLGSIEVGKRPGLLHLNRKREESTNLEGVTCRRIV